MNWKQKQKNIFIFFAISLLFVSSLYSQNVLEINDTKVSKKEFQNFLNVQKFLASQKNLDELLASKKVSLDDLLQEYIEHILMLQQADNFGFKVNGASVNKLYNDGLENWLLNIYMSRRLDIFSISISEEMVRAELANSPKVKKSFTELTQTEKNQLGQISMMRETQKKKDALRATLEKKYKVKVNGLDKDVIFSIDKKKYSQDDFNKFFDNQLKRVGLSRAILKSRDPVRYETLSNEELKEMLLKELAKLEMKREKFENNINVVNATKFLKEQIAIDLFIKKEIAEKITVSDEELEIALEAAIKNNPNISRMLPTEQERLLREAVRRQKLPVAINQFLTEIRDLSVIKRNRKEIDSLK